MQYIMNNEPCLKLERNMTKGKAAEKQPATSMLSCRLRTDLLERLRTDAEVNYRSVASELAKILDEHYGRKDAEHE